MHIRLIAVDLDGTLLHDDMTISEYSRNVIRRAAEKVRIVVATGRMFDSAREKVQKLGLGDIPIICYTGAWIRLAESGRLLHKDGIPANLAEKILGDGRRFGWLIQSYVEDEICLPSPSAAEADCRKYRAKEAKYLGEAFYHPETDPTRLIIVEADTEKREQIRIYLEKRYGSQVEMVYPGDIFLDIHRKGVSKANALHELGELWGITPQEMVSFGNTENDASMLRMTGLSYAVANSEIEAKKAAKDILPLTNNEDGPAHKIQELLSLDI